MGLWSETFGNGNSFTESVANTFTPEDGASYVSGTLTYDDGAKAGETVSQNDDGSYGNDGQGNSEYTGSGNNVKTNATLNADDTVTEYVPKGTAPEFGLDDAAWGILSPLSLIPKALGKFTSWTMGIDPKTNSSEDINGRMVYTKPKDGDAPQINYSYNFLGQPYTVEIIDGKVVDANSIVEDATGKREGDAGFDPSTAKSGYDRKFAEAEGDGDDGAVEEIKQYQEDNANEDGEIAAGRLTSEVILDMATKAGVITNQADMEAIIADPEAWLSSRGLKIEDLLPTLDADAAGTNLDPYDARYALGETPTIDTSTAEGTNANSITKPGASSYTASTSTDKLDASTKVNAATGVIDDDNLVNADDIEIDVAAENAGTGVLGNSLDDFASQNISTIIDTSTPAGKLLAERLGQGNYTDHKATILGQMKIISAEFKDSNGNPKIPVWAQAMARDTQKTIAFSGISGTAATAAYANAIMEATLGVADKEASFFQTLTVANLDNRQEAIINKAKILANFELSNLDAREAAAVSNAKAFLDMDLKNLTNEQQAEVIDKQAVVQALFEDQKAINAQRLFTAESENDFTKFYDELNSAIERHNSIETNSLAKFNAGEANVNNRAIAELEDSRDRFYSNMQYNIDVGNAKWRQTVETTTTKMIFEAVGDDVKNALDISQEAQNRLWDSVDNLLDYIFKGADNEATRDAQVLVAQIQASAKSGSSSGGLLGTLGKIAGVVAVL